MTELFDTLQSRLNLQLTTDPPIDWEETHLPDLYVGLEMPLLAPGDGIITDRHHASADRYEADDPMNQIGGQISAYTLSGWLRHACERIIQRAGGTACHPGEPDADYARAEVYSRDLDSGYHPKGSCTDDHDQGCIIYDLFGGFGSQPGKLLRHPISFSPIRRQVDVTNGEAEGHYRQLSTHVRSRNEEDGGKPLRQADRDVVANLEGTFRLTLREYKPEFIGLLGEAISHLDAHSTDYAMQLGGARNFGAGVGNAWLINPLYTEAEISRVFDRAKDHSDQMAHKDSLWAEDSNQAFVKALQARMAQTHSNVAHPTSGGAP